MLVPAFKSIVQISGVSVYLSKCFAVAVRAGEQPLRGKTLGKIRIFLGIDNELFGKNQIVLGTDNELLGKNKVPNLEQCRSVRKNN